MLIAGVDEAGRGALAGPVVAAAVILPSNHKIQVQDSKKLTALKREKLFAAITATATAFAIARVEHDVIDDINILQAALLAMRKAVLSLKVIPDKVLIDGNQLPKLELPMQAIIQGDSKVDSIAAASILAKVSRDKIMCDLEKEYPGYDFAKHKGYPTSAHKQVLLQYKPSPVHRLSFAGVL